MLIHHLIATTLVAVSILAAAPVAAAAQWPTTPSEAALTTSTVLAIKAATRAQATEQVLIMPDHSGSMAQADGPAPGLHPSRWQAVMGALPGWIGGLHPGARVGVLSFGGDCGNSTGVRLPIGTGAPTIEARLSSVAPGGETPLNAALEQAPAMFDASGPASKRIVLLSDGLNSCPPQRSTCEIARSIHDRYGIRVDVAAWVSDPAAEDIFRCVARVTGGTFIAPTTPTGWRRLALPGFDPWSVVVLVLGVAALSIGALVVYRHLFHVVGWDTHRARLAAALLVAMGVLALYLNALENSYMLSAVVGLLATGGLAIVLLWPRARRRTRAGPSSSTICVALALATAPVPALAQSAAAREALPATCDPVHRSGEPRRHHFVALDVSGTTRRYLPNMKALLRCYARMYSWSGDEFTLLVFGMDESGSAREVQTFSVPPDGAPEILDRLLDDLALQAPARTRTYFRPLADTLADRLRRTRYAPVVLIVSDGISDGLTGAVVEQIGLREVRFESLGTRGIYRAPGMDDWSVAVQGGAGLDLTALFARPIPGEVVRTDGGGPSPPIDPCLLQPPLVVETAEVLRLRPLVNPLARAYTGELVLTMSHQCVERFRKLTVEVVAGGERVPLPDTLELLITQKPKEMRLPLRWNQPVRSTEAIVQVRVVEGGTAQVVYPVRPGTMRIQRASYAATWGALLGIGVLALGLTAMSAALVVRARRGQQARRPLYVRVLGGGAVALSRNRTVGVGGEGAELPVPGLPAGRVLATITWRGQEGVIEWTAETGVTLTAAGRSGDHFVHPLGEPVRLAEVDGTIHEVTVLEGRLRDLGTGTIPDLASVGGGMDDFAFGVEPSRGNSRTGTLI